MTNNCTYRSQPTPCKLDTKLAANCGLCLQGQLIDTIELQTSAIMNLTESVEERLIP